MKKAIKSVNAVIKPKAIFVLLKFMRRKVLTIFVRGASQTVPLQRNFKVFFQMTTIYVKEVLAKVSLPRFVKEHRAIYPGSRKYGNITVMMHAYLMEPPIKKNSNRSLVRSLRYF